jgi:hypothetical protein
LLPISAALARHLEERLKASTEQQMTKKNAAASSQNNSRNEPNLDSRYGEIGISAVAAALQYQSEAKNPAYAPVAAQLEKWLNDAAA